MAGKPRVSAALGAVLLFLAAAPAGAGTARFVEGTEGSLVVYEDPSRDDPGAPGEANELTVGFDSLTGEITFTEAATPVVAGEGCTQAGLLAARCPLPDRAVRVLPAKLDDSVGFEPGVPRITDEYGLPSYVVDARVPAGAGEDPPPDGDDVVTGTPWSDTIHPGRGADRADGGDGDDRLTASENGVARGGGGADALGGDGRTEGGPGDDHLYGDAHGQQGDGTFHGETRDFTGDALHGGPGTDTVEYSHRSDPVAVDLRETGGQGSEGEGDAYDSIENATGTRRDDVLIGDDGPNDLEGGDGADRLIGNGGDDHFVPGSAFSTGVRDAADVVDGGHGDDDVSYRDRVSGGVTIDLRREAGQGAPDEGDTLRSVESAGGGLGDDLIIGDEAPNYLRGGLGDDRVEARDGGGDRVSCDPGDDAAVVDREDVVEGEDECEALDRPSPPDDGARGQPPSPAPDAERPPVSEPPAPRAAETPHPAKLQVRRARVARGSLDVFAPISRRADGRVRVTFHAAGRILRFDVPIDAERGHVRFRRRLPRAQRRLGTGIVTLEYPGNARTRPQAVRVRAARNHARLTSTRPQVHRGRLYARGTVADDARGVVRVQLSYIAGGEAALFRARARIRHGRWRLRGAPLPAAARAGGHAYVLFTGHLASRTRGEMRSLAVPGA